MLLKKSSDYFDIINFATTISSNAAMNCICVISNQNCISHQCVNEYNTM